jgi:hypothetical protein
LQVSYSKVEVEAEVEVEVEVEAEAEENEAKRETITDTEIHQEAKRCKEENHWIKSPRRVWGIAVNLRKKV